MSRYWNSSTRQLSPYVPGEQPKDQVYIKLNTNENPYPPSPHVLQAIRGKVGEALRLYPDPESTELRDRIAEKYGLKREEVFVGNGSDEVLALAFKAFFEPQAPVLFADITYSFYKVYVQFYDLTAKIIPLKDSFQIDIDAYCKEKNGGIVIANPNAPTGIEVPLENIERIIQSNPDSVVLVDEAYVDFGAQTTVPLVRKYPNVLVVQTLSKSRSLAGLRVGFAFGHPELIEGLNRVKNSFNSYPIDRLAQAGAVAAIEDEAYFRETTEKVIRTRTWVVEELQRMGFEVLPSKTNFVFVRFAGCSAAELQRRLKEEGILVRHFAQPRIDEYLRITIGTDDEMKILLDRLQRIIQAVGEVH
ncbi:histidinol-phosphate aminotransferase [Insulibacter thermoxylanivorax]|uniref:Histidinol-phosphate aminotransferase n=1 Tax=Insulibacter thermoxylanivorax TaxID=2749268 RepID=A0A916VGM7_9BACL|nr:histidinol-phosphate transaminase [Insulibacter thermoxylanivorax]GFR38676.1 histidinol-phosphate aminotransferase [Insulibacter thermoxylanivorax]